MSARVLPITMAIKNSARTARNIRKLKDPDTIAIHVWDKLCEDGYLNLARVDATTKANMLVMGLAYIKSIITMRVKKPQPDDERQFHLWDDLDQVFDIKYSKKDKDGNPIIEVVQKELGKFGLDDIRQITEQKNDNLFRANKERDIWLRAISYIKPLLATRSDWNWEDAVEYMRENGGLPTLDEEA
jgi:hypothetical protein